MSLVNDMLRDLEKRRAAPGDSPLADDLYAVDEAAAARRDRSLRLRRGLLWFAAVMLGAFLIGNLLGRVVKGVPAIPPPREAQVQEPAAVTPVQLLEVLPQHQPRRFVLQLLLDRTLSYQRLDESGAVSLVLPGTLLPGEPRHGRLQQQGRSLSWRVEQQGDAVHVLLVGLGGELQVEDRLEALGTRWQLWLQVDLQRNDEERVEETPLDLPVAEVVAEPASESPPDVPPGFGQVHEEPAPIAWPQPPATQRVPARPAPAKAARGSSAVCLRGDSCWPVSSPQAAPQVHIQGLPDPLQRAREALAAQRYAEAISELQALHQRQPGDHNVTRWLARAYLAAGQLEPLLAWLPGQLQAQPGDTELRLLLARGQLQQGQPAVALATLQEQAPSLDSDPAYHAVLAAAQQQAGQWAQSAATYQALLARRGSQGAWHLGLALALDRLQQAEQARLHYQRALQDSALEPATRDYIAARLRALGGQ